MTQSRCRWALGLVTLHTRCNLDAGHHLLHSGRGLESYCERHGKPQIIEWNPGMVNEYETDRDDAFAWEVSK